jgi:hydrogenase maturation protease
MGDDGFGAAVVDALAENALPTGVSLATAPDVLHLASRWQGESSVWLVDTVVCGARPGTVYRFGDDAVRSLPAHPASAHHLSFGVSLRWLLHARPALRGRHFRLWGAEPAELSARPGLSRQVAAAVAPVVGEILSDLEGPAVAVALREVASSRR